VAIPPQHPSRDSPPSTSSAPYTLRWSGPRPIPHRSSPPGRARSTSSKRGARARPPPAAPGHQCGGGRRARA
jgi:hypothetical protein